MMPLAWTIGWTEMIVICVVALIVFGGRLPDVGRNLGRTVVGFKKGLKEMQDEIEGDVGGSKTEGESKQT